MGVKHGGSMINVFIASLILTYSPILPLLPIGFYGYFAALLLVVFLLMVILYICISRFPLDLVILEAPVALLGVISIYEIALKILRMDSLLGISLFIALVLILYILLAISRLALKRRRVSLQSIEDPMGVLKSLFGGLRSRLDVIMISLGLSLVLISTAYLVLVSMHIVRDPMDPVYLYNPLIIAGSVFSSLMVDKVSSIKIVMPAASWASAVLLYSDIRSRSSVRISLKSRVTLRIPGIVSDDGEVELPLDTRSSPHIIVSGNTGSGKTSLCKILARAFKDRGVGVIIIDHHGEYTDLEGYTVISAAETSPQIISYPLEESGMLELVDSIRRIFRLGALQVSMLTLLVQETVKRGGKGFKDLLDVAEEALSKTEDPQSRDVIASLIPYLRILATHIRGKPIDLENMISGGSRHVVFNMGTIGSDYASMIYVEYVLKQIWRYRIKEGWRRDIDLVVIIDEAHNILRGSSEEFISRIFRESRKYGLSLIISTQQFEKLSQELINNTDNFFFLRHTDPRVVDKVSLLIEGRSGRGDVASIIRSLKPLEGLLYNASSGALIRVRIVINRGGYTA